MSNIGRLYTSDKVVGTKMKNIKYISIDINTLKWEILVFLFCVSYIFLKKMDMMQTEGKLF